MADQQSISIKRRKITHLAEYTYVIPLTTPKKPHEAAGKKRNLCIYVFAKMAKKSAATTYRPN